MLMSRILLPSLSRASPRVSTAFSNTTYPVFSKHHSSFSTVRSSKKVAMANQIQPKSYLDLIESCDKYISPSSAWPKKKPTLTGPYSFPHIDISQTPYSEDPQSALYQFLLPSDPRPHGFMLPSVVEKMPWTSDFKISAPGQRPRTVQLLDPSDGADPSKACNEALRKVIQAAIEARVFQALRRIHSEDFKVMGANFPVQMQRSAAPLFGIANRGAHMTMYVRSPEGGGLRIWVPRRSESVKTHPGMLDNSAAGGCKAEETPFESMLHEADEEASLSPEVTQSRIKPVGVITYICQSGEGSGGELGLVCPDVIYVYDLEVGEDVIPEPRDGEAQQFYLWDVETVKNALVRGEFKPNCALVMIDFFTRHGIITDDNEKDYLQLQTRLRRTLPVPTSATS